MNPTLHSITLRLTIALGAIALLVFSAAGTFLYRAVSTELAAADNRQLLATIEVVRHFIEEARATQNLADLRHHLDDVLIGHGGLGIWLEAADGTLMYGDPASRVVKAPTSAKEHHVHRHDGLMMDAIEATLGDVSPLPFARVRVAIDTRPRERVLATYRNALLAVCGLGVLLAVTLGGAAAWRGLMPVKRLSMEAASITPNALGKRLSTAQIDAELTGLARAFNGALDRLEAAYRQMEGFSADVAHELRTPLATLINGTELMLSSDRSAKELKEALSSNLEELEHLKALVNDMLFLARADEGDKTRSLEQVDLTREVDRTIAYCEALLEEAQVHVAREGTAAAACDASLIRRALVNLLSNAITHTDRGKRISVRLEPSSSRVRISVFNPGTPISPHIASRMFDRFFRADKSRFHQGENHGLGLAIVRAIAQMHGGVVFVEPSATGNRIGLEIPAG